MSNAAVHYADARVEVTKLVVGTIANNVFIVRCVETNESVLIDAASEPERLLPLCQELKVRKVLTTHGHWDHIGAVPQMRSAQILVGVGGPDADDLPAYDFVIEDASTIEFGNLRIDAIATPGHTPGSTCFAVEGAPLLFTGDTLFPGGPGATRFPGSSFEQIIKSVTGLFDRFSDDTIILPGHGDDSTIGTERPALQSWIDRGW